MWHYFCQMLTIPTKKQILIVWETNVEFKSGVMFWTPSFFWARTLTYNCQTTLKWFSKFELASFPPAKKLVPEGHPAIPRVPRRNLRLVAAAADPSHPCKQRFNDGCAYKARIPICFQAIGTQPGMISVTPSENCTDPQGFSILCWKGGEGGPKWVRFWIAFGFGGVYADFGFSTLSSSCRHISILSRVHSLVELG